MHHMMIFYMAVYPNVGTRSKRNIIVHELICQISSNLCFSASLTFFLDVCEEADLSHPVGVVDRLQSTQSLEQQIIHNADIIP